MSNKEKAAEFSTTFFPTLPPADLSDIDRTTYQEPVPIITNINIQQLEKAITKLSPSKAPGPDEIANSVIKKTFDITQQHLLAMTQSSINFEHFPKCFKETTTIVLRKPQMPDHTKPNAYGPIALQNTLGKILESVVTDLLSHLTETHNLLPPQHFGGRPGRSGEEAMTILSEKIYAAWKEKDIYSVVFMDVRGARASPKAITQCKKEDTHAHCQMDGELSHRTKDTIEIQWHSVRSYRHKGRCAARLTNVPITIHVL